MAKIVIIDDEVPILQLVGQLCRRMGHEAFPAKTGREGMEVMAEVEPDLLIVDLRIGDMDGLQIIRECRKLHPRTHVIMVTGYGSVETAVEAMKLGAFDYLTKPFDLEDLQRSIRRAMQPAVAPGLAEVSIPAEPHPVPLIGESQAMRRILTLVDKIADQNSPVLLEGEYGAGKQMTARAIHNAGRRAAAPFKMLHCSSLPEALLEAELFGDPAGSATGGASTVFQRAAGGTAVLEEIDELPLRLQSLLEAFLENISRRRAAGALPPELDFRFIATASQPLEPLIREGKFREDLYYRISIIPLTIPPLRSRREDIPPLVRHFLTGCARASRLEEKKIDREALRLLQEYPWPGNTGELQNAIERACAFAEEDCIQAADLPPRILQHQRAEIAADSHAELPRLPLGITLGEFIRKQERLFIRETLHYNDGSREKTAGMLDISIATLYRKMELKPEPRDAAGGSAPEAR